MKFLNINSELTWKSDFDISQTVIPFEKESIKELKSAVLQAKVDPIGRVTGKIPSMPTLKKQFEEAKKKQDYLKKVYTEFLKNNNRTKWQFT